MLKFRPFINRLSIFIVFALFALNAQSQVYNYEDGEGPTPPDSIRGLYVGLNLGYYFANKNTARIYDGSGYYRDGTIIDKYSNLNSTWLFQALFGSPQAQDRTERAMGGTPYEELEFSADNMPELMTYSGSFMYGGHLRYMFNSDFGVFFELSGTNPVTVGRFSIRDVNNGISNQPGEQGLTYFGIRGEEQRLLINLGMHRVMMRKSLEEKGKYNPIVLPYFDAGMNMTFVKFEANFINLESEGNVDLMTFYDSQGYYLTDANVLTGVGVGGFAAIGAQITIGRKFTIDIGYVASFETVKLGKMKEFGLQNQLVLKAIYM